MCHVFRCDTAARVIANTLRDICKRIMIERSLQLEGSSSGLSGLSLSNLDRGGAATRPTDLPTENRRWVRHRKKLTNPGDRKDQQISISFCFAAQSFPTPMEEPKKVLKAQYLGALEVNQPTGMDVINEAIDTMMAKAAPDTWMNSNVSVAPSMISVVASGADGRPVTECRVRYLSFLGIGRNVKNCAFIMHTAQDKFIAHIFQCEPSSGALCKTIEAACKVCSYVAICCDGL